MNDTYGRVAALRPANTDEAELYEVPTGLNFVGLLSVCNQTAGALTYRAALTDASGAAAGEDWLAYDESIPANEHVTIKVFMNAAQTIRIKASSADEISFVLHGLLIDNR